MSVSISNLTESDILLSYQKTLPEKRRKLAISTALIVAITVPLGVFLDYWIYPNWLLTFASLRILCVLALLPIFMVFRYRIEKYYWLDSLTLILPVVMISTFIYLTEGSSSPYYGGINLVLLGVGLVLRSNFKNAVIITCTAVFLYVTACLTSEDAVDYDYLFTHLFFILITGTLTCLASDMHHKGMFRDFVFQCQLTHSKEELEAKNQKLIEIDKAKGHFFANISHELKTPLTLILAPLSTLIKRSRISDRGVLENLHTMHSNALRLLRMINDLLDLVKLQSSKMRVAPQEFLLGDFLKEIISLVKGLAEEKNIQLKDATASIGDQKVCLDRSHLEKILLNLLFNSLKFTPSGGEVSIEAQCKDQQVQFTVLDTGKGISEEQLPHIFDAFWQFDSSSVRSYQGIGIGLAMVKELTELMEGKVEVESFPDRGTKFLVTLPLSIRPSTKKGGIYDIGELENELSAKTGFMDEADEAALHYFTEPVKESPEGYFSEIYPSEKKKILIADDEPAMLHLLSRQLSEKYEVIKAVNGSKALNLSKKAMPDLLILDMMMPEMDGIQVTRALKKDRLTEMLPVLMLTARSDETTKLEALYAGVHDFLPKPFSVIELEIRVENIIRDGEQKKKISEKNLSLETAIHQLKESENQLVQSEKFASMGRLSAGLVHEINNPLSYVKTGIQYAKSFCNGLPEIDRSEFSDTLSDIDEGVNRVVNIISDLKSISYSKESALQETRGLELMERVKRLSNQTRGDIPLIIDCPEDLKLLVNVNQMTQVLLNFVNNSCYAIREIQKTEPDRIPEILLKLAEENDHIAIKVRDNGCGMDQNTVNSIFDPFFTSKPVGSGMGLGLSLCFQWIKQNRGEVSVESKLGEFTELTIKLNTLNS